MPAEKRTLKKKFFPGYILIKMIMNDRTWHLVKNTDKITGFVGGTTSNPAPISEAEAESMLGQLEGGFKKLQKVARVSMRVILLKSLKVRLLHLLEQ